MKREVKPEWALVNEVGTFLTGIPNQMDKALAFHQMNLDYYPNESRSYVALGDFYLSQKEEFAAIEYYKKAIEMDGNKEALLQLKKLKN